MNPPENLVLSVGTELLKLHPGVGSYGYLRAAILAADSILFMLRQNSDTFWSVKDQTQCSITPAKSK